MNSIDEVYADSIPPHQDEDSFRPKANPSNAIPMPSRNDSERSRSERRHRDDSAQSQLTPSDMHTDFDTAVTSERSTIPISSNSTVSKRSRSERGNRKSEDSKRDSSSSGAPGAASSSHERPSVTQAVPNPVTLPIHSNTTTTSNDSQQTIPYDNDVHSDGPPELLEDSDSDAETIAEFQGFYDDVEIPSEEPSVPAFWDTSFQASFLAQSHPLRRPVEFEQFGNYSNEIQFELPPHLSCWLVNPVYVQEGHV